MSETEDRDVPKIRRRTNKFGQEQGNYYVKVGKKKVDLKTESYIVARERAREAFYDGKTDWGFTTPSSPAKTESLPVGDWASDLASAVNALPPIRADQYTSPSGTQVPLDDEKPPSSAPKTDDEPSKPKESAEGSTQIPPEMFAGMLRQLANIAVELQLMGQEWLIKRYAKVQAGPVPVSSFARTAPAQMWETQFKKWIPEDVPLPEYIVAPLLLAMLSIPVQLSNAQPLAKDVPPTT